MGYGNGSVMQGGGLGQMAAATSPAHYDDERSVSPRREPMVAVEFVGLERRIEQLHACINELEARLSPVLQPEAPSTTGRGDGSPQPSVPLAAVLMTMNQRLDIALTRVGSLLGRLEI